MRYSGVVTGHVETITLAEPPKLPVAKVLLTSESPPLTRADEFQVSASGLLGDRFIEVIPATTPGSPLPNAATVRVQTSNILHLDNTHQIAKTLGNLNLLTDLLDLPEPKNEPKC